MGIDSQEIYYENYITEFKGYEALEKNKKIMLGDMKTVNTKLR